MFRPALTFLVAASCAVFAQVPDGELVDLAATRLNRSAIPQLGLVALASKSDWKHGETANFIYHFTERTTAAPIAAEAEFFYRVIARELERDTTQWEQKAHIFVFETDEEWRAFQTRGMLDPRSGGIHAAGALFLKRRGAAVMNNETLAHEVAHLVAGRFFGLGIPLWLNEGFHTLSGGVHACQRLRLETAFSVSDFGKLHTTSRADGVGGVSVRHRQDDYVLRPIRKAHPLSNDRGSKRIFNFHGKSGEGKPDRNRSRKSVSITLPRA
jgi:hypothetical protein